VSRSRPLRRSMRTIPPAARCLNAPVATRTASSACRRPESHSEPEEPKDQRPAEPGHDHPRKGRRKGGLNRVHHNADDCSDTHEYEPEAKEA
jgi:hypothetical protein